MSALIFHLGTILTQDPKRPFAAAVGVRDGRVFPADSLEEARQWVGNDAEIVNLNGRTMMPAFNDAHIHIWKVGDLLTYMLDLRGVRSREEMLDKISDFAVKNPENAWILARGFNEATFDDRQMPTRHDLDKVSKTRPIQVIRTCAHIAVLNSKALEICNINRLTKSPDGGE